MNESISKILLSLTLYILQIRLDICCNTDEYPSTDANDIWSRMALAGSHSAELVAVGHVYNDLGPPFTCGMRKRSEMSSSSALVEEIWGFANLKVINSGIFFRDVILTMEDNGRRLCANRKRTN